MAQDGITYSEVTVGPRKIIRVSLGRRKVGEIRQIDSGYFYQPTGGRPGEVFPTVEDVKRSLEE